MEDPGDSSARGFNAIIGNTSGGGNLNLRVNGDGSVQTVTSAPSTTWFDVPNLSNAVQFSVDSNNDGDFSDVGDVLNVHRLVLRGDYSTSSPEYTVLLSQANETELQFSGTANLWFGSSPTAGSSISSVSISAQNSGGDYAVDQVFLRMQGGLAGDYNGDGAVDAADYVVWRKALGSTTQLGADGDGSGYVSIHDYNVWRQNFGNQQGINSAGAATVPEPHSLVISALAAVGLLVGREICHIGGLAQMLISDWGSSLLNSTGRYQTEKSVPSLDSRRIRGGLS
jgi:hypothetical protein